jgi:hypothetical protein
MRLEIEPIPNHSWGISLAHLLPKDVWASLRYDTLSRAGNECEICEDNGELECHEIWEFDDTKSEQRLKGLESCCILCHEVHHFGRSKLVFPASHITQLINHWCDVNQLSLSSFKEYEEMIHCQSLIRQGNKYKVIAFGRVLNA